MSNPKVFINPKSGSIRLTGTVEIVDAEGNLIETIENPKFCGCGHSKDKPWCDGSHKKVSQPVSALENARLSKTAIEPFAPETGLALQIREKLVSARTEKNESIVGLKIGGALESKENQTGVMIYGFLTDAMDASRGFDTAEFIYPRAEAVESRTLLVHFLREKLNLTGAHIGCETSHCGACTVDIDGLSVKSCTCFAVQCEGSEITTVEGLANGGVLHAVQEGFYKEHGLQCGFCTPGMLTRAYRFLQDNPSPTEEEIRMGMSGNLCRCTGYQNIVKAVQYAANKIKEDAAKPVAA